METIIKKAIEGGYNESSRPVLEVNNDGCWVSFNDPDDTRVLHQSDILLDPLFWQALGKACGWDKPDRYWSVENDEGAITLIDVWENNAMTFHEINLTEGWDKAVAYLESLIK